MYFCYAQGHFKLAFQKPRNCIKARRKCRFIVFVALKVLDIIIGNLQKQKDFRSLKLVIDIDPI